LVESFLKDSDFLMVKPNLYNTLGLGLTQLYNTTWVYNHMDIPDKETNVNRSKLTTFYAVIN
jgi:hypothetical protein